MTPFNCASFCQSQNYLYAGVQYSSYCFCGNSYGSYGYLSPSQCMYNCSGDSTQKCGGDYANAVMYTNYTLPSAVYPSNDYIGTVPILIVPTVRTCILSNEMFGLTAQILSQTPPISVTINVAPLSSTNYVSYSLDIVTSGRQVYNVTVPSVSTSDDFQYYVEATFKTQTIYFPSTAPAIPQTVVVISP